MPLKALSFWLNAPSRTGRPQPHTKSSLASPVRDAKFGHRYSYQEDQWALKLRETWISRYEEFTGWAPRLAYPWSALVMQGTENQARSEARITPFLDENTCWRRWFLLTVPTSTCEQCFKERKMAPPTGSLDRGCVSGTLDSMMTSFSDSPWGRIYRVHPVRLPSARLRISSTRTRVSKHHVRFTHSPALHPTSHPCATV